MVGNVRVELSSASPDELSFPGNYPNGQRGYPGVTFDRSGSFREGSESRMFSPGSSTSRGGSTSTADLPPVSLWLTLDPITMGAQRYTRAGELRKVLGISFGSAAEDNSFGAAHMKPPPVATEELKQFKSSILETFMRARTRAKKLDECLQKLNKYCETIGSKKQQRSEMLTNERSGSNLLKMGTLMQRNPSDVSQRLEDRTKNGVMNKRVRSSMAELRAEGRSNMPSRLPLVMGKDRDMHKDNGESSDLVEEKIRRLPAGGEGWDKKMKRKRSIGTVFTRPMDTNGELKRVMHHKLNNESDLQLSDTQGFRSGLSNGTSGINKFDGTSLAANSSVRGISRNDVDKLSLSRDFVAGSTKEKVLAKGNNKLNIREDDNLVSNIPMTKGKASRGPRSGPIVAANSSPNFPRSSGALDGWEQSPSANKVHSVGGANNRKRPLPSGSSSPPMAQWGGQRPQKISRTRRTNLVSPVSNLDELQVSSEGCPRDLGSKVTSVGTNELLLAKGMVNGTQLKIKHENVSSPARLSESEESAAGENRESRLKDKSMGSNEVEERIMSAVQNIGSSVLLTKKNRMPKEESGDGVRRQGRSGRGSSNSRASFSPTMEKLENPTSIKPLKSNRPGLDKSGSKSGRPPLKKLSDRKVTRLGLTPTGSPDISGESDDDREELLEAANFACNASNHKCLGSFWEQMEPIFAPISLEDVSYLKQELRSTEDHHNSLTQGDSLREEDVLSQTSLSGETGRCLRDQNYSKESAKTVNDLDQVEEIATFSGRSTAGGKEVSPLYQRILSALIVEDNTAEFEENGRQSNAIFQHHKEDLPGGTCLPIDVDARKGLWVEAAHESILSPQAQKHSIGEKFPCNGFTTLNSAASLHPQLQKTDDLLPDGYGFSNSERGMLSEVSKNGTGGPLSIHIITSGIPSPDCQYGQMSIEDKLILELLNVGVCVESVPDLADGEDEIIDRDIAELQRRLNRQVDKKKKYFNKIINAVEEVKKNEGRNLEQVAMDRLVETAYRKRLATRASSASKSGITKVSKQVALAFIKRTLARCQKFEETGKSCFTEPAFRDVLFSAPPRGINSESVKGFGSVVALSMQPENNNIPMEPGGPDPLAGSAERLHHEKFGRAPLDGLGTLMNPSHQEISKTRSILNRGKKKEVLLDDVGGSASLRAASALGNSVLGGAKGKRSERERDKDTKVSGGKSGRSSIGNLKGERKTKSKPKQKTAQLSTSGSGYTNKLTETTHPTGNKKRDVGLMSHDNMPQDSFQEMKEQLDFQLPGFDSIEELGVANQDLDTWLNFEEDGLQDQDLMGLQIPMDDLSDIL